VKHLVFQLYGPMASWGEIAAGGSRTSDAHPSKSAVMGLLGAALGVRRDEDDRHVQLSETFCIAIRVGNRGELLRDYHTTEVPGPIKKQYYTRKQELHSDNLNTILSDRDYRVDAHYMIAMWQSSERAAFSLEELQEALQHPRFNLYLGRKSCPLALPLCPQIVEAESLSQAFSQAHFPPLSMKDLPKSGLAEFMWEEHPEPGLEASMVYTRRDKVLSRKRWQFEDRREYYAAVQED
jgi:CRISPR system Cascade subunit CasD